MNRTLQRKLPTFNPILPNVNMIRTSVREGLISKRIDNKRQSIVGMHLMSSLANSNLRYYNSPRHIVRPLRAAISNFRKLITNNEQMHSSILSSVVNSAFGNILSTRAYRRHEKQCKVQIRYISDTLSIIGSTLHLVLIEFLRTLWTGANFKSSLKQYLNLLSAKVDIIFKELYWVCKPYEILVEFNFK